MSTERSESVRAALRDAVRRGDVAALAVVPVVLLGVFALPAGTRESLAFAYRDPTLATAYTAHFVHLETGHLAANLLGYVLLAGSGYVFAVLAGRRRLFGVAAATFVLAFPFALSALNLAVPRNAVGYGFSGVNMAFAGLLGLLLVAYASRRVDGRLRVRHAPGAFFAAVAVVTLVALPAGRVTFALAGGSALLAAAYVSSAWRAVRDSRGSMAPARRAGWLDLGLLGAVLFLGYPFVGFPAPSPAAGTVVNLYVHLLGFCLGFLVPYVALAAGAFDAGGPPADHDRGFLSD
ncbi:MULTISPECIES: hypothetical protein [Halobacterium]|uniref:hypothetical protein n=1 Tax=Halobacterium TaxID=2239 RepID=UPI00073E98FF|nr:MULTISPECIES: hypothetical protein [Halobacterium]MCG1004313.1 hypothetical protein [Halobacterium noricense]